MNVETFIPAFYRLPQYSSNSEILRTEIICHNISLFVLVIITCNSLSFKHTQNNNILSGFKYCSRINIATNNIPTIRIEIFFMFSPFLSVQLEPDGFNNCLTSPNHQQLADSSTYHRAREYPAAVAISFSPD